MPKNIPIRVRTSGLISYLDISSRLPAKFIWLNALGLVAMASGVALAGLLPQGPEYHSINPGAVRTFFNGRWYPDIALHG